MSYGVKLYNKKKKKFQDGLCHKIKQLKKNVVVYQKKQKTIGSKFGMNTGF